MPLGTERPTRQPIRPVPSHTTDYSRLTRRGSNPDWWNQFVEPQLETFQKQPLMRIKGLAENVLGDPTDTTNMAVGWLTPAARKAQSKVLLDKLAQKMEGSRNNINALDIQLKAAPNRSQDIANQALEEAKRFALTRDTLDTAKKYPHVLGHQDEFETLDKIPPSLFNIFGGTPLGDYHAGITPHKERLAARNIDPTKAREIAKENYLNEHVNKLLYGKYIDGTYLDEIVKDYLRAYDRVTDFNQRFESAITRNPKLKESYPDPEEFFASSIRHNNWMVESLNDIIGRRAQRITPKPEGRIRISGESENVPNTTKHELLHAATAIKGEPSAWQYAKDKDRYGYWLSPDEIRARAVAAKRKPSIQTYRHYENGQPSIKTSWQQNDYLGRLLNEINTGATHSTPEQVKAFWDDLMSGSVHMPTRWVDSPHGGKVTQPFRDWVDSVYPDYLRLIGKRK